MKRSFSKKQRMALANHADWKCTLCGTPLDNSFHADHIIPFSKGGITDVSNGQALCPTCNMQKGNRMSKIVYRDWQSRAMEKVRDNFSKGKDKVLVQATPGGGKTIFGLGVFDEFKSLKNYSHILVIVPSTILVHQWREDAHKLFKLSLKDEMMFIGQSDFYEWEGMAVTFQAINESPHEFRKFVSDNNVLVVIDEVHHTSDGNSWGDSLRIATENADNILMLTGTPWNSKGYKIPYVEYDEDGFVKTVFSYGKAEAIADGICRVVEFHKHSTGNLLYTDEESGVVTEYDTMEDAEDDGRTAYSHAVKKIETFMPIFLEADRRLSQIRSANYKTGGGLIVAPDIQTAHKFQDAIKDKTGIEYEIVHSKSEKPHKRIKEFRDSQERWLISVNMVSEGVDIKRLQVCVFMSTAKTELFFRQVVGRIERIRVADKLGEVDFTASFYTLSHPVLNEWIDRIEKENGIGVEALKERQEDKEDFDRDSSGRTFTEDDLKEIEILSLELTARGIDYDDDLVNRAFMIRKRNMEYMELPMYVLCKIAKAEMMEEGFKKEEEYMDVETLPLVEQKENIKKTMTKEISRKIAMAGLIKERDVFKNANYGINKALKMKSVNDASMEMLEKRLDYIYKTGVAEWL